MTIPIPKTACQGSARQGNPEYGTMEIWRHMSPAKAKEAAQ